MTVKSREGGDLKYFYSPKIYKHLRSFVGSKALVTFIIFGGSDQTATFSANNFNLKKG